MIEAVQVRCWEKDDGGCVGARRRLGGVWGQWGLKRKPANPNFPQTTIIRFGKEKRACTRPPQPRPSPFDVRRAPTASRQVDLYANKKLGIPWMCRTCSGPLA